MTTVRYCMMIPSIGEVRTYVPLYKVVAMIFHDGVWCH